MSRTTGQKKPAGRWAVYSGCEAEMSEQDSMGVRQVASASPPLTWGDSALSCCRGSGADGLSRISWRRGKASWGSVYSWSSGGERETLNEENLNEETLNEETLSEETLNEETLNEETLSEETLSEETLNEENLNEETLDEEKLSEETEAEGG